jgi:type 2A phosphatase activator TIP41
MGLPREILHDFNWTFTTDYQGTMKTRDDEDVRIEQDPPETLNLEKLMVKEKILFFDEIPMFEDELHDNGISNLTIKIVSV